MTTDRPMELGMVGLGRMGSNLVRRLMADGHRCVAYDVDAEAVTAITGEGAAGASSIHELVAALQPRRAVWVMVPAGEPTEAVVRELAKHLEPATTCGGLASSPNGRSISWTAARAADSSASIAASA